jgi:hypothetical protein
MHVLQLIESGLAALPALPDLGGEPLESRVRAARAALAGAVRRSSLTAARSRRRGETVARICVEAASVLGVDRERAELAGLVHNVGELWLLGLAEGFTDAPRFDEMANLLQRYQASASIRVAEHRGLPGASSRTPLAPSA